jgi:hypothetical protein
MAKKQEINLKSALKSTSISTLTAVESVANELPQIAVEASTAIKTSLELVNITLNEVKSFIQD